METCEGGIEAVRITERLNRRRLRARDFRSHDRMFFSLSREVTRDPSRAPQRLVDAAQRLCAAGSAGISVLRRFPRADYLCWKAVAGLLSEHTDVVVTPRDFSPCGAALESRTAQLFYCPGRFFTYLNSLGATMVELLVVPIQADDLALGTLWVARHDTDERQFDAGDLRIMTGLSELAAFALQRISAPETRGPTDPDHRQSAMRWFS